MRTAAVLDVIRAAGARAFVTPEGVIAVSPAINLGLAVRQMHGRFGNRGCNIIAPEHFAADDVCEVVTTFPPAPFLGPDEIDTDGLMTWLGY